MNAARDRKLSRNWNLCSSGVFFFFFFIWSVTSWPYKYIDSVIVFSGVWSGNTIHSIMELTVYVFWCVSACNLCAFLAAFNHDSQLADKYALDFVVWLKIFHLRNNIS